jgi:hypothetical protein
MGKKALAVLAVGCAAAIGIAALAAATTIHLRAGNLLLTLSGTISPKALAKNELTPIDLNISGKIATSDGTHPSAFRESVVNIDKNGKINVKGIPVCKAGELEARDTKAAKKACGNTIVGSGSAHAEIAFPEQNPIKVASPLTLFNGGEKNGKVLILAHTFITVPAPTAIVTQVTIKKIHQGRFGFQMVAKVPVIAGGSGSAIDFKFKLGRTYSYKGKKLGFLEAKCPDGHLDSKILSFIFKNETRTPGVGPTTDLNGSLAAPCTPKG